MLQNDHIIAFLKKKKVFALCFHKYLCRLPHFEMMILIFKSLIIFLNLVSESLVLFQRGFTYILVAVCIHTALRTDYSDVLYSLMK